MTEARFIQIHTLHGYAGALLNRDDSGLSKRLPYGEAVRTRISSQCLKRHWRIAPDGTERMADLDGFVGASRSRDLVDDRIAAAAPAGMDAETRTALMEQFNYVVYGDNAKKKQSRQPLMFGEPELAFLSGKFAEIAATVSTPKEAEEAGKAFAKEAKAQMKAMRESASLPGGLTSALFGRMVTSDPAANIDAPVHVAHAFTVHAAESEQDYFSVVDDLKSVGDDGGADHIGETELTSGLFYGYVVLDIGGLVDNLGDRAMAGRVAERLIRLIAEVSPGAKRGSTAPYGYAHTMLIEAGDRQPRSLAEAFRDPCDAHAAAAERAMRDRLASLDDAYATGEARRYLSLSNDAPFEGTARASLPELGAFVREAVESGRAA